MLKVMIVDDEIIVRVGFQSCINWEAYGCQVVSTCESGGDAVEYMNRDVPDIVFTDIMMPGMDGIQLVKYISENHPDTKVVVLSCVDEIDYVKKAIKLGAEDYILKLSFTQDTLVELITRLKSMIEEERKKAGRGSLDMRVQSFNREEDLKTLLLGNQGPGDNEMLLDRLGYTYNPFETYQAGCFLVDDERMNRPGSGTDSHIRKYGLLNIVREYLENLPKSDLAFTGEHEIVVLFRREGGESPACFFPDTLDLLNHALKTHLNLTLSMGMGQECLSRMDIPAGFAQARRMAALRFFDGPAAFHCGREAAAGRPFIAKRSVQRNMQEAIFRQDAGEAFRLIDSWFEEMAGLRSYDQIQAIRRGVVETDETVEVPADTVIAAVGEKVPGAFYESFGIALDSRRRPQVNQETLETSVKGVYVAGDGLYGPATVVEGIRDGKMAAEAIIGKALAEDLFKLSDAETIYGRKGRLAEENDHVVDSARCLSCNSYCENCVEVCPNRANISLVVPGMEKHQIIHVDYMCNECGNCKSFCPWDSAPYLDKFTLFANEADMENSKNQGFTVLDAAAGVCRVRLQGRIMDYTVGTVNADVPDGIQNIIRTVINDYSYML